LFLNKYIEEWYSKYISWIRIIPRKKDFFPRTWFFEGNKIKKYNVEWEEFKIALKKYSIPLHLSHSKYINTEKFPNIVSWWMFWNESSINFWIELENIHDEYKTNKKNIDDILEWLIIIMQKLDKSLNQKFDKNIWL
jgi:hypothetical protein